jgi:PTS system mannose-specific IIC component
MTALSRVASFLPAIGMAALMGYLVDDIWGIMFFVFGFAMNGYLGLSTTAIIFPAVIIAYLYYRTISNKTSGETVKGEIASEEEII